MNIKVKLFATLRDYDEKEMFIDVNEGTAVIDVVQRLNIPEDEVAIIMVNGRSKKMDYVLKEEDVLALFPAVGGG